jgi:hypothetical protein
MQQRMGIALVVGMLAFAAARAAWLSPTPTPGDRLASSEPDATHVPYTDARTSATSREIESTDAANTATDIIESAIEAGRWTADDRARLLRLLPRMDEDDRDAVSTRLLRAVDEGRVTLEGLTSPT